MIKVLTQTELWYWQSVGICIGKKCESVRPYFSPTILLFNSQEDLQVAVSQGGRLLDCIKEPIHADPDYNMTCDEVENLATVQR